jgi:hypothetical protein
MVRANAPNKTDEFSDLSNHEIVVLAASLVGGRSEPVDTEDVAVKADEIAPGRFTWRKYTNQINIDNVRWALLDAKKPENGGYVIGSAKRGWQLTPAGARFCNNASKRLKNLDLSRQRGDRKEEAWARRERARLLNEEAYRKFADGKQAGIPLAEVERFFRVDDYVVGEAREARLRRVLNLFGQDPKLGEAVRAFAEMLHNGAEVGNHDSLTSG